MILCYVYFNQSLTILWTKKQTHVSELKQHRLFLLFHFCESLCFVYDPEFGHHPPPLPPPPVWIFFSFCESLALSSLHVSSDKTFVSSSIKSYPPPPPPPGVPALWLANSQQWYTDSPPFLPRSSGAFSSSSVVFCICCCHTCVLSGVCDGQVFWFLWIIIQMRSGDQSGDCWCL